MSEVKLLVNSLYPAVQANLSDKKVVAELTKAIQGYFDRNAEKIFDTGLTYKILFLNSDKEAIFKAANLDPDAVKAVIKQSKYIKEKWKIMNEPLNTTSALILRYFAITKQEDMLKLFLTYYSFYFYSSLYHKYLPYGANENVMAFTVNNLSNKFLLKKLGSLYKTIEHIAITSHETYKDNLIKGEDGDLAIYISALKVRLNDVIKNIKNEYTNNHKDKLYVNYDEDNYDEENFHMADNNSYSIKRISDSCIIRLTTYGPDMQYVKLAADMNNVSENEIRNVILSLGEDQSVKIQRLCELILQLFLFEGGSKIEEVRSQKFFTQCMDLYKKSNTNDQIIIEMKEILDGWLKQYSLKYTKTNRKATLSYYRKAIFTYFVIHIQQSSSY